MRTFTSILIAGALGLSSAAFAATPDQAAAAREARMAEALQHYRDQKAAQAAQPKAPSSKGAAHHHAGKKHATSKPHPKKHHAKAHHAHSS